MEGATTRRGSLASLITITTTVHLPSVVSRSSCTSVVPVATSSASPSTSSPPSSTVAPAATASAVARHLEELGWDDLLGVLEDLDEVSGELRLVGGEVRVRGTLVTRTTGSPDTVDVVLDTVGKVVVDDVADVLDVCGRRNVR